MATATAQLNTRMDKELKSAGDAALARAGVSPTKLVRLVWKKAAQGGAELQQLLSVLGDEPAPGTTAQRNSTDLPNGHELFFLGLEQLGIDPSHALLGEQEWKDVREETVADRLRDRSMA